MNKYLLKTICFLFITVIAFGQTRKEQKEEEKYKERSIDIQEEVWSKQDKAFDVTTVPDKYKNESAVIIAKSVEINAPGAKGMYFPYFTTIRERVLINDKSALEEYSTLSFKKIKENSITNWKDWDKYSAIIYIGAKVVKQDGKVIKVNTINEEIITQNSNKGKDGKIAIPDLQVGDIVDYYYRIEDAEDQFAVLQGPAIYFLAATHPILYYNVNYTLNKKASADIMAVNGAKEIKKSYDKDENIHITFSEKDLPKISSTLWTSLAREIPYYIIRYGYAGAVVYRSTGIERLIAQPGDVETGPYADVLKNNLKVKFYTTAKTADRTPYKNMKEFFGGKSNINDIPADSVANYLYNYYRWSQYGTFSNMDVSNQRNYLRMNPFYVAAVFTEMLRTCDINCDLVLVSDRYSQRLKDVFSPNDFDVLVRVNDAGKISWYCFNSFFQDSKHLSGIYQGENALLLTREGGKFAKFKDTEEPIVLPISKSSDNVWTENLKVTFDKDNLQLVNIDRNCKETGSMKESSQQNLLLAEDIESTLAASVNKENATTVMSESHDTKSKALAVEVQRALDKERVNQKDHFKSDIKDQYEQDPKELISYKINNTGLTSNSPVFDYSENFTMENFVQKAGNNYIFDVGKLMGTYSKIEEKDNVRTMNVYMSNARTFTYNFSITIPDGYTVKGIDELNKKVDNDIASFVSTAKIDGNTMTVSLTRIYNHNFEPASNWSKLVSIINASSDFTMEKLLFEKKK